MSRITWNLTVQVTDGPRVVVTQSMDVEAYERIEVRIPAGEDRTIDVAAGADRVGFLLLRTRNDVYPLAGDGSAEVTYEVVGGGTTLGLDGPQIFNGSAASTLLGAAPQQILVTNNSPTDITAELLVARDATA
jgi:hypothetical protein